MRIRLLGVGVKMGIVDRGHAQSDDVIRCPETFADHEYTPFWLASMEKGSKRQLTGLLATH